MKHTIQMHDWCRGALVPRAGHIVDRQIGSPGCPPVAPGRSPRRIPGRQQRSCIHAILWTSTFLLCLATGLFAGDASRTVISLDGTWQIADGGMDQPPANFERTVAVPGLASWATPAFAHPPGPKVANPRVFPQKDPKRDAFWYRRTFGLDALPTVARLKVHKAMFGTKVILNGQVLGEHRPCFTPGYFDARAALKAGENELLIRVGADRNAVTAAVPSGFDYEKCRYIPGIFDSVELICSGTPHILNVQTAPEIEQKTVRVQIQLRNEGAAATTKVKVTVREAQSGTVAGKFTAEPVTVAQGGEATVDIRVPIENGHLWSPEDPFLYVLEADTGSDRVTTRFGMRSFRFDPATGRAVLNGKPYFMRGSNITLYRFMEDPECKALPWSKDWVRTLHRRIKDMHWNCLRYCIGFPPEFWYDIADEEGILIQDEFPIWHGGKGWSTWPKELQTGELAKEYTEWMRERWNHPCVVIWDANNETTSDQTGPAIAQVRGLDLSNRPWDNSYMPPAQPGDVLEEHPYHFINANFKLHQLVQASPAPWGKKGDGHGVIINEYGWLWLNRDGTPTTLTSKLYANLLEPNSTTEQRRTLYARYTAAETEFWRVHRKAAAVVHFTALGYSRPDGQTSDHWIDLEKLTWEPEFYRYVRDAFAPVGLMIDAWADDYPGGQAQEFPVIVVNDLYQDWHGTMRLRLMRGADAVQEKSVPCEVPALREKKLSVTLDVPAQGGTYQLEAALLNGNAPPVRSLRDFSVMTNEERAARHGLAVGKPVKASTSLTKDGVTYAAADAVDGRGETRWSSEFSDPQWLAVDLGQAQRIARVELDWEGAFGKVFAIEISADGETWKEVYRTEKGKGGTDVIRFEPVEARWVRMNGSRRGTEYGYSLWEMRVFEK